MKSFHILLMIASLCITVYEISILLTYGSVSQGLLVLILSLILSGYCYGYLKGHMPLFITICIFCVLASFLIIEGMIYTYSCKSTINNDYDTIIVLGAQVKDNGPSRSLQYRIDTAVEYASNHPDVLIIASGGKGDNEPISEAQSIQEGILKHGNYTIILEDKSTSTLENLEFSAPLIQGKTAIISNGFHLYRVSLIAKQLNLDFDYIPAPSHQGTYIHFMIREYFGVLKEYAKMLLKK